MMTSKRGILAVSSLVIAITMLILSLLNYCCASSDDYETEEPSNSILEFDLSKRSIENLPDFKNLIKENLGKDYTKDMIKEENIIIKVDPTKVDLSDKTINLKECSSIQSVLVYRDKTLDKEVLKLRLDCPFIVDIPLEDK